MAAFGIAALVPTGLAFWWLRKHEAVWRWLSRVALAVAASGPLFLLFILVASNLKTHHPELGDIAVIGMDNLMLTPFFAIAFIAGAFLACGAPAKRLLWIAAAIETGLSLLGAMFFLVH